MLQRPGALVPGAVEGSNLAEPQEVDYDFGLFDIRAKQ